MKRTAFAIVVALAALGLLGSLALESRPLPVEVHVAQYSIGADLERIDDDFRSLVTTLSSSWSALQPPGEGARALLARVESQPQQLPQTLFEMRGSGSQENRLRNSFDTYTGTISEAVKLATELLNDQSEYAAAVAFIRESGGRVIQQMRDQHFERSASDTFQLVVGTLDFAGSRPTVQEAELRRLLVALGRDQHVDGMPADVLRLRNAMETVVTKRDSIRSKLEQLAAAPVVVNGKNLGSAAQDLYKATVARVDQARLMLSVYAVVLLLAVGFVAFRLHGSYREINAANDELARLNESLEQRVTERTNELAGTLTDLKESQVQLVQAEKMSSLGQLVAGISHEINTPLLYLANNAELIQERVGLMREVPHDLPRRVLDQSRGLRRSRGVPSAVRARSQGREADASRRRPRGEPGRSRGSHARQHRGSRRAHRDGAELEGLQPPRPRADREFRRQQRSRQDAGDREEHHQAQGDGK